MDKYLVFEEKSILPYLERRGLIKQYKKTKSFLEKGFFKIASVKIKQPKEDKIYYFRINKQYRGFFRLDGNKILVFEIDNHQN